MEDRLTTLGLISLVMIALVVWLKHLPDRSDPTRKSHLIANRLLLLLAIVTFTLFIYRWFLVRKSWLPLTSHLDGLLLMTSLFGVSSWYLGTQKIIVRISLYSLPCLVILYLWAICASTFTSGQFSLPPKGVVVLWKSTHLLLVYAGFLFSLISACAGMAYLVLQWRLRHRKHIPDSGMGNLESTENVIVKTVTLSFLLVTMALITGIIIYFNDKQAALSDLLNIKVAVAFIAWLLYASLTNIKRSSLLRGSRGAWLSIVGLLLILITFAIAHTPMSENEKVEQAEQVLVDDLDSRVLKLTKIGLSTSIQAWRLR